MIAMREEFLTVKQVAEMLQVSEQTVNRWIKERKLVSYKLGRDHRITSSDLQKFMEERKK